ncbi:MAG: helix-turn-helix transcriptional regulator [Ktedonobacteraceae bacterium]
MINRNLIEARKARGWTQMSLASQLAVSSITISRWENGIQVPQAYYVQRLCQIFSLTDKELGFVPCKDNAPQEDRMVYEEMERYFTFGKIKTAELISHRQTFSS